MSKVEILILGASGFLGSSFAFYLISRGMGKEMLLACRDSTAPGPLKESYLACDLTNKDQIAGLIRESQPEYIFNLSGGLLSSDQLELYKINTLGTVALLEAVVGEKQNHPKYAPRIIQVGSAAEYGEQKTFPIKENAKPNPVTHYGISKTAASYALNLYALEWGFKTILVRAFNIVGPGMGEQLALSAFARQIALIEKGLKPPLLEVGNLYSKRDFLDIADFCQGLWLVGKEGKDGEIYNLCSGRSYALANLLEILLSFSASRIEVKVKKEKLRKIDPLEIRGSFEKIQNELGWKPQVSIEESLRKLLDYWRAKITA